jgi:hypothetical protein
VGFYLFIALELNKKLTANEILFDKLCFLLYEKYVEENGCAKMVLCP